MRVSRGRLTGLQNQFTRDRYSTPVPECSARKQANPPDCKPGAARGGTGAELHFDGEHGVPAVHDAL